MADRNTVKNRRKVPELLSPAGSLDSLRAAVNAGADAVYIGGRKFGARAYAENPEEDLLREGIRYAHIYGAHVHLTVNTLLKDAEMKELESYLMPSCQHPDYSDGAGECGVLEKTGGGPRDTGERTVPEGTEKNQRQDRHGGGDLCSRRPLLFLLRSVPHVESDRGEKRKPRKMRTALPASLCPDRRKPEPEPEEMS